MSVANHDERRSTARLTVFLCFLGRSVKVSICRRRGSLPPVFERSTTRPQLLSYFFSASNVGLFFGRSSAAASDWLGRKHVLVAAVAVFGCARC